MCIRDSYYSEDGSFYRVYFPLHTAIVEVDGETYTADEYGNISLSKDIEKDNIKVIGRKKSEHIRGTGSNIIKEKIIRLNNSLKTNHLTKENQAFYFNIGERKCGNCCSLKEVARLKSGNTEQQGPSHGASCVQNHGGVNCSTLLGMNGGRCPFNPSVCMDYNGYFTDCENASGGIRKYTNFIGSDCDIAMGMGYCWNEL